MALQATKYTEIDKTYTGLWKLSKEELKEKVVGGSRVTLSFDQYVDKGSLVAQILARHYSQDQLEEYDIVKAAIKVAEKKAKRAVRRAQKKSGK